MNQLRNRLIAIFLVATLVPLAITVWLTTSLLDRSLRLASTRELDQTTRSLELTGRAVYQQARELLKRDIENGIAKPRPATEQREPGTFAVYGSELRYYAPEGMYSRPLGVDLESLSEEIRRSRELLESLRARDLRRGFFITVVVVVAAVWVVSAIALVYFAHRISRPIHQLTEALGALADGNLQTRVERTGTGEVAVAMDAFNHMAAQLEQSQERLVFLTRLASWQALARKMAHEVKNSLTPIRLTMEEVAARAEGDAFLTQAAGIVVDEVATLERRVRAFSEFAAEPPVRMNALDVNALVEDRIALLRSAHPEVAYELSLGSSVSARGDEDLVKSILTNLLENAADAVRAGGTVRAVTRTDEGLVVIEVHDSGPGLSPHARESLFQPTISFKKTGMGLGLSIARRSALLCGGDIVLIESELGGAAFRVTLKAAPESCPPNESSSSTTKRTSVVPSA